MRPTQNKQPAQKPAFADILLTICSAILLTAALFSCNNQGSNGTNVLGEDMASKAYVPPGKYDEFYAFMSGGFSGQVAVYGLPSGRLFRVIPVFSQDPEKGYGYSEETKALLMTSHGYMPWGDAHHPQLSRTAGTDDGKWLFINENNTPRVARVDLTSFTTAEIIELPNSAGNHSSPFCTENTEYVVAGTRFSVPVGDNKDVAIDSYKGNFKGTLSFIKVDPQSGRMNLSFQIEVPGFDWDLSRSGKGPSHDWSFFTCYNSEEAHSLLEVNASQNDKDFILAVNWKKLEEVVNGGGGEKRKTSYCHNVYDESTQTATSSVENEVRVLSIKDCDGAIFLLPCPKSPHGCDIDPSGEYIVGDGKLAAQITVFGFSKMLDAIKNKAFDGDKYGIPVIKYEAALAGEVKNNVGLGPLHTEFDDKGYGYTTMFISSEIVKWKIGTWEVVDRIPVYYSPGHLMIPGGDGVKPWGKYLVSLNKITKDRYLPTGPELCQSAQLIDISGDKMKMISDFPTIGEPHYAQAMPTEILMKNSKKIYKLEDNHNPYAVKSPDAVKVTRDGNRVDVYLTTIRSHFTPDNIEGIKEGDDVYFHVTNLEQDWDEPHGFAIMGNCNSELLIMPGETRSIYWKAPSAGIYPMYCTDFCSALHQEMQGYIRVSPKGSDVPLKWGLNDDWKNLK
ncbi:MAG: Sec-dependent nitrous-oxide reductase [Bacteroidia bacterium]